MNYPDIVLNHFFNPYHASAFNSNNSILLSKRAGSVALGALFQFQLCVEDDHIIEARFKAWGNPYVIAAASYVCGWLEGKTLVEMKTLPYRHLIEVLSLPKSEQHIAILFEETLLNLKVDYEYCPTS